MPTVPLDQHETWPDREDQNEDRQLSYEAEGNPSVELPEALSDDLSGYWQQEIQWGDCAPDRCGTILVPLDWENPGAAAVSIAFRQVGDPESPLGPLFVNPGGPGFGGQDLAQSLAGEWEGYNVVGWDPRGTGDSTTVECGTTEETDEVFGLDGSPDSSAEEEALREGFAEFAQDCRDASGALLDHLTTVENVRDLDLLRFLFGADELNFVGISYGTYVGAMYAELFPDKVGRLVLDAAVDITNQDESVSQSEGFELALRNYAEWCAGESTCQLGDSADAIIDRISDFLSGLDAQPLPGDGERELTQSLATTGIALFLYFDEAVYPSVTDALDEAFGGDGASLLWAADELNGRTMPGGYETGAFAFPATRCVDWVDEGVEGAYRSWEESKPKAKIFAVNNGLDLACQLWTADSGPLLKLTGKGAAPILVVGTTGDSATPYEHAVSMADQLESGHLLTFDGAGHGAVTSGNECVSDTVSSYLIGGTLPEEELTCS
ncbi:MAG: alpha/beta hydrolase [Arachnia sp.]